MIFIDKVAHNHLVTKIIGSTHWSSRYPHRSTVVDGAARPAARGEEEEGEAARREEDG